MNGYLREQTEWVETVEAGWNQLVGANTEKIRDAVSNFQPPVERPLLYGNGQTSKAIVRILKTTI